MLFNLHTHTNFCDGSHHPEEYIREAIRRDFKVIGFSGHAPVPFENKFAIKNESQLNEYCNTILELKEKYKDQIEVYLALEFDYIPGITNAFKPVIEKHNLDYSIGGIHLVKTENDLWFIDGPFNEKYENGLRDLFNGDIKKAVGTYFTQINEMITNEKPDIIAHFDKIKMHNRRRFFNEEESWYRNLVRETLDHIQESDTIVEINTRGVYRKRSESFFPSEWIVKLLKEKRIRITINSDAHKPEEVSLLLKNARKMAKECGYREVFVFSNKGFVPVGI